jgi:hypothetical protein
MIELIKWCFRDSSSGFVTILVLGMLLTFLYNTIHLFILEKDQ